MSETAADMREHLPNDDMSEKNRRVLRVLLAIIAALVVSAFLVGIRW